MANSQPTPSTSKQVSHLTNSSKNQNNFNDEFKLMLLELLFTRGYVNKFENFRLKTGVTDAEKFGDIIFDEDNKSSHFIQINCLEKPTLDKIKSEDLFHGLNGRYSLLKNICSCITLQEQACYKDVQKQNFYTFTNIPFDLNEQNGVKFMMENTTQKQITIEELPFPVKHLMYIQTHQHNANYYRFVDETLVDILFEQANKLKGTVTDPKLVNLLENLTKQSIENVLKKIVFAVFNVELSELQNVVHDELIRGFKRDVPQSVQMKLLKHIDDFVQNDSSGERTFDHANTFFNDNIKFGIQEGLHGNMFSVAVIMLLFTRAYFRKLKNFTLETEVKEASKFDDIVFSEENQVFRCIQLKHKQDEKNEKIQASDLFGGLAGNYSLLKYLCSYFIIKKNIHKFKIVKDTIVYTNIPFDLQQNDKLELVVDKKHKSGSFYGNHTEIDVQEIVLDKNDILKFDNPSVKYYNFLDPRIIEILLKQRDSCINSINDKDFKSVLNVLDEVNVKEALKHIFYAVVQPNEQNTFDIVKEEMKEYFKFHKEDEVFLVLKDSILGWIAGKNTFDPKINFENIEIFFQNRLKKIQFEVSPTISTFVGRDSEILAIREKLNEGSDVAITHSKIVRINGLGGIGKTELAKRFIDKYKETDYFGRVIWIDAETQNTIKLNFGRVCTKLDLKIKESKDELEVQKTKSKIDKVLDFFKDLKVLFVFDNVESSEETVDYLSYFRKEVSLMLSKPHILITTRNKKYGGKNLWHINLDTLSEDEAIALLKSNLSGKIDVSQDDLEKLANLLQGFPLALQQAIAFIVMENEARKYAKQQYTIKEYIKAFEQKEEARKLLNFQIEDDFGDIYTKTTYTTWQVTFDAIKKNKDYGLDAITLLENIAYFAADDIDLEFLRPFLINSANIGHAIQLLINYSLINENKTRQYIAQGLNIHRLVQKIVQINNAEKNKEFEILHKLVYNIISDNIWSGYGYFVDHCNQILSAAINNDAIIKSFYSQIIPNGWQLIHYAAYNNNCSAIECIIKCDEKFDLNVTTQRFYNNTAPGETPLHIASHLGHLEVVKALHKHGATINKTDSDGETALLKAIHSQKTDVAKYLIDKDDSLDTFALLYAVRAKNIDIVKMLIEKGISVDTSYYGRTALHYAVENANVDIVKILIEKGVSLNIVDDYGRTALHGAVEYANVDILKVLIEKGALVNIVDEHGRTALHNAVRFKNADIVKILVENGVLVDIVDDHDMTALDLAEQQGQPNIDIIKALTKVKN